MKRGGTSFSYQGRWRRPTAWWCVMVAPLASRASPAAFLTASHCAISSPARPGADEGEVRGGAVGVDVREAAREKASAARRLHRRLDAHAHALVQRLEAVPRARRLERVRHDPEAHEGALQVRRVHEGLAPRLGARVATPLVDAFLRPRRRAAVLEGERERAVDPRAHRLVRRLEGEEQHRAAVRRDAVEHRLARIEQAAVGRVQAALRDRPRRARPLEEAREPHARRRAEPRPRAHAHPRLGHDPERPLRPEHQAIRRRPRARRRQAARREDAARRDHAHRLHEVVHVRVERREVPARARRDPAAERRVLEALRVVAQGEAVRRELLLEVRPEAPAWMRAPRDAASTSSTRPSRGDPP